MTSGKLMLASLGAVLFCSAYALPAQAQATRTWVSGVGDDANPCSRTAPCKTFAGAISKTAASGEINCIDPGGFGVVTITKAITIACDNTLAGVLASGTTGIVVAAGASDVVVLRGLDIEGVGTGIAGIRFTSGAALHVQKSTIRNFRAGAALGILFLPSGASELYVSDTVISRNGTGSAGGGILVQPTGTGSASGLLLRAQIENNITGIRTDTTGNSSTAGIHITVRDSISSGNGLDGIVAASPTTGSPPTSVIFVDGSASTFNAGTGIVSTGINSGIILSRATVTANSFGLSISSGGVMLTFQNNSVFNNISGDGNPSSGPPNPLPSK